MNLVATFPDGKFATGKLDNQPNFSIGMINCVCKVLKCQSEKDKQLKSQNVEI